MANAIIGVGFDDWVQNQIIKRQKVNRRTSNKTIDELRYQNNNTAFLRLTSAIDINGSAEYAKAYQLFNTRFTPTINGEGTPEFARGVYLNPTNNSAYGWRSNSTFGHIPPPGLISADVKSQNRGSLKEANINLVCHNKDQFEIISKLYLRIGYSMLLEWGWSYFFHNDDPLSPEDKRMGRLRENYSDLDKDFLSGNLWGSAITIEKVLQKINNLRKDTCGNYDAIFGRVSNYSWSLEKDGSYNITLTLKTWGDIIESLKANTSHPSNITASSDSSNTEGQPPLLYNQTKSSINRILWYWTSVFPRDAANDPTKNSWFTNPEQVSKNTGLTYSQNNTEYSDIDLATFSFPELEGITQTGNYSTYKNEYYVRLGAFLRTLQNFTLLYNTDSSDEKKPAIVSLDYDPESNFMFTYPRQGSIDPRICLVPLEEKIEDSTTASSGSSNDYIVTEKSYRWKTIEVAEESSSNGGIWIGFDEDSPYKESETDYADIGEYLERPADLGIFGGDPNFAGDTQSEKTRVTNFLTNNFSGKTIESITTSTTTATSDTLPTVYDNGKSVDNDDSVIKQYLISWSTRNSDTDDFFDDYVDKTDKGKVENFKAELGKEYLIQWDKLVEEKKESYRSKDSVDTAFSDSAIFKFSVTIRTYEAKTWTLTNPNSVYSNANTSNASSQTPDVTNKLFENIKKVNFRVADYDYIGRTMNILVNMNFIAKVLEENINLKDGSISYFTFLDKIMTGIQSTLGNLNNFNVIYDEDANKIKIIDSTFIPGLNKYKPDLFKNRKNGLFKMYTVDEQEGSFVRDASIKSKMSNAFATMTTIGAQARGNIVGENATALSSWNDGLTDRVIKEKATEMQPSGSTELKDAYPSNLGALTQLYTKINDGNITSEDIDGVKDQCVDLFKYEVGTFIEGKKIAPLGFLPIDLELTFDGLSGVKIYETYTADDRLLPKEYREKIQFITTGVSHRIQNNDWTTTLNSITSPTYEDSPSVNPNIGNIFSVEPPAETSNSTNVADVGNLELTPSSAPASKTQKDLVKKAFESSFAKGQTKSRCARGTYNHALNLTKLQNNQTPNQGMIVAAGGNANQTNYHSKLEQLGYKKYSAGNNLTKDQVKNILIHGPKGANGETQPWVEGDVVVYWANEGDFGGRKYGHTQMYVGNLVSSNWVTDNDDNYGVQFVYNRYSANNYNLLIFKAPVV
jgi:hypothetical protein